jgi:hypothetical protein
MNVNLLISSLTKYVLEGLAVGIAIYLISKNRHTPMEIIMIAGVSALTLAILDMWAPGVALGTRQGTGFGIGFRQVGFGDAGADKKPELIGYDENDNPITDPAMIHKLAKPANPEDYRKYYGADSGF